MSTPLLLDTDKKIGAAFGLNQGDYPQRWTFVINKAGKIAAIIKEIDFANHAAQIVKSLG